MRNLILALALAVIASPAVSQTLLQPYQVAIKTNDATLMTPAGCTNLSDYVKWQDANAHQRAGYATTNQLNVLSNSVISSLSNMTATVSNAMNALVYNLQVKTSSFQATNGVVYACDPNGGTITVTMPASPETGWNVTVLETAGAATAAKPIILTAPGKVIMGASQDYTNALPYSYQRLIYVNDTYGWRIY